MKVYASQISHPSYLHVVGEDAPSRRTAAVPKRLANLQHLPQKDATKGAGGRFGEAFYQPLARASSHSCESDGKRPWEERLVEAEPQLVRCAAIFARPLPPRPWQTPQARRGDDMRAAEILPRLRLL